jgi:hypothetical protein
MTSSFSSFRVVETQDEMARRAVTPGRRQACATVRALGGERRRAVQMIVASTPLPSA